MSTPKNSPLLGTPVVTSRMMGKGAANRAIQKMSKHYEQVDPPKYTPERHLEERDGWQFIRDDGASYMAVLIDVRANQIWMSLETWVTIREHEEADLGFTADLSRWGSGMRYLVTEAGKYADAARAKMNASSDRQLIPCLDPLSTLEQDAQAILIQVASFQGEPSPSQVQLFAERLADVRARFTALREQLDRVEDNLDLAGVAIMDATE